MIRIDAVWMSTQPLDMRAGPETALARVVQVFGAARPHHAYLFANARANRLKVLVHDGFGVWLAIVMFLNVWGIIWPNQKRALGIVVVDDDKKARAARVAMLASRTNLLLSLPMLTAMAMYQTLFG